VNQVNILESMVVEQTGLSQKKALDLLEAIFVYLKASVSCSAAAEIDQLIAPAESQNTDLFIEARKTFFGLADPPSGLKN
jgi:hypothetical protein